MIRWPKFIEACLTVWVSDSPVKEAESIWDYGVRRLAELGRTRAVLTRVYVDCVGLDASTYNEPVYVSQEEPVRLEFIEPAKVDKEGEVR